MRNFPGRKERAARRPLHCFQGTSCQGRALSYPPRLAASIFFALALCFGATAHAYELPEHNRLVTEVVATKDVTHAAVASGDWHDQAIWQHGQVPAEGARVLIPWGFEVKFKGSASVDWIWVEGKLAFDHSADATLRVSTLAIDERGDLDIGTPDCPASGNILIEFNDSEASDWTQLGHGLVSLGKVSVWGKAKEVFIQGSDPRKAAGWSAGDALCIPGVAPPKKLSAKDALLPDPDPLFREQHKVVALDDSTTIPPATLPDGYRLHVANLTRNIVIRSANPSITARRGHIMLMGPSNIGWCQLKDLGRTRTEEHVTDPRKDHDDVPIPETVANVRGRYSLHFHQLGPYTKSRVEGVVCQGGLKWGIVNHGSNVDVSDCVAFDVHGSSFATENGVEHGSFRRCLSIFNRGAGVAGRSNRVEGFAGFDREFHFDDAKQAHLAPVGKDWGMWGYGFWLQGPLVTVEDCISYGAQREGFAWTMAPMGTDWEGKPCEVPIELVPEQWRTTLAVNKFGKPRARVPLEEIPTHQRNNVAIGSHDGLGVYFSQSDKAGGSSLTNCAAHNCFLPLNIYSPNRGWLFDGIEGKITLDIIKQCYGSLPPAFNKHYSGVENITFRNCVAENYATGINTPRAGTVIEGDRTLLKCLTGVYADGDATINLKPEQFQPVDKAVIEATHNKKQLAAGVKQAAIEVVRGETIWNGEKITGTH